MRDITELECTHCGIISTDHIITLDEDHEYTCYRPDDSVHTITIPTYIYTCCGCGKSFY